MKTDFHNKDFALSLALKWRLKRTLKWPIANLSSEPRLCSFVLAKFESGLLPRQKFPLGLALKDRQRGTQKWSIHDMP